MTITAHLYQCSIKKNNNKKKKHIDILILKTLVDGPQHNTWAEHTNTGLKCDPVKSESNK